MIHRVLDGLLVSVGVPRQGFLDNGLDKLREALAHRCGDIRPPAGGAASDGYQ